MGPAPRTAVAVRLRDAWPDRRELRRLAGERGAMSPALGWLRNDVLVALVVVLEIVDYAGSSWSVGKQISPVAVALLTLSALPLLVRRRHPRETLAAVLTLQTIASLAVPMAHGNGVPVIFALYAVARLCPPRTVALAWAAALPVLVFRGLWNGMGIAVMAGEAANSIAVIAVALWVRKWRRQVDLNRELLADRAVAEERRRIARELHDVVAHHITTMYLMSGGARTHLDQDPETSREALVTLEASARTALREMRQMLGVLRGNDVYEEAPSQPQPGVRDIDGLITESRASGLSARLVVTGEQFPLPVTVGLTLYRIAQEALTNVRKHAGDASADVHLVYRPDRVTLEVTDDGNGSHRARGGTGGGYGLVGMRERVAVHGGSLEVGSREEGGFRVAAEVPLPRHDDDQGVRVR
ncbi:sensor histidine kinase [Streptomyces albipurpureus]|uniref:histidine kinase n=1 Tax=Streptomyces albipurpureus TaxID=2897419 RepID=A0ABT0UXE4_9ACTN|nr:histidine kinase [Streptomyces sp. CWNU-1]MCM2393244.1 histidine kinase [Streptomyces sp. CWNU-1]